MLNLTSNDKELIDTDLIGSGVKIQLLDINNQLVYEYQTAKICDDDGIVEFIKEQAKILSEKNPFKAKCIPVLPEVLTLKGALHVGHFLVIPCSSALIFLVNVLIILKIIKLT